MRLREGSAPLLPGNLEAGAAAPYRSTGGRDRSPRSALVRAQPAGGGRGLDFVVGRTQGSGRAFYFGELLPDPGESTQARLNQSNYEYVPEEDIKRQRGEVELAAEVEATGKA